MKTGVRMYMIFFSIYMVILPLLQHEIAIHSGQSIFEINDLDHSGTLIDNAQLLIYKSHSFCKKSLPGFNFKSNTNSTFAILSRLAGDKILNSNFINYLKASSTLVISLDVSSIIFPYHTFY